MNKELTYTPPFNLGEKVYTIQHQHVPEWIDCNLCKGVGRITIGDETRMCPDCYGRKGLQEWTPRKWRVVPFTAEDRESGRCLEGSPIQLTIRQIRLIHTKQRGKREEITWEAMCEETGIGSGTIHDMSLMFSDVQSAQKACDERNAEAIHA